MTRYETASGVVTERVRVDLAPDEAEAFSVAYEHLVDLVGTDDAWPILRGLRRIHTAHLLEQPPTERSTT